MFMLPLSPLLRRITEPTSFLPPFFSPPEISSFWGNSTAIAFSRTQKVLPTPVRRRYLIGSSPMTSPLNDSDIPTLLHCSSGCRSSADISFAPAALVLSCSWQALQDLGPDHLPNLPTVPLYPAFRPNKRFTFLEFSESSLG